MLLGVIFIVIGVGLMIFGVRMLWSWLGTTASRFDASWFDRGGSSKTDRQFLDLYFIAAVLGPLLGGAMLIVFGLSQLQWG